MPIRLPAGRTGIRGGERGVTGRIVHPTETSAFSACVVSGARGSEMVSVDAALRVRISKLQVAGVRRVNLAARPMR